MKEVIRVLSVASGGHDFGVTRGYEQAYIPVKHIEDMEKGASGSALGKYFLVDLVPNPHLEKRAEMPHTVKLVHRLVNGFAEAKPTTTPARERNGLELTIDGLLEAIAKPEQTSRNDLGIKLMSDELICDTPEFQEALSEAIKADLKRANAQARELLTAVMNDPTILELILAETSRLQSGSESAPVAETETTMIEPCADLGSSIAAA